MTISKRIHFLWLSLLSFTESLRAVKQERDEKDAILLNMTEGILLLDENGYIRTINHAAADLLHIESKSLSEITGKKFTDITNSPNLLQFYDRLIKKQTHIEEDIVIQKEDETFLQVNGTLLINPNTKNTSALLVFNNVTRLKKLERVRKEFVGNVSHELRTPITIIKGFIETLEDGAIDSPEDARNFISIMHSHANRLATILEDLLYLSKIEHEQNIPFDYAELKSVIEKAVETCEQTAQIKNIKIEIDCDQHLKLLINPPLIEQALTNLLDNAIKYSENNSKITIKAQLSSKEITLSITDQGCGIPESHLPHLFQRFYRVDKARSRKMGGTGLGLAIVKHIAQAHEGRVSVTSKHNSGSTFRIHLPIKKAL